MESVTDTGKPEVTHQDSFPPKPFVSILDGSNIGRARGGKPSRRTMVKKRPSQGHLFKNSTSHDIHKEYKEKRVRARVQAPKGKPRHRIETLSPKVSTLASSCGLFLRKAFSNFAVQSRTLLYSHTKHVRKVESSSKTQIIEAVVTTPPRENPVPTERTPHTFHVIAGHLKAMSRIPYFAVILVAIVFFGFAGTKMFTGASNFPVSSDKLILPDEDSVQAALLAYLNPEDGADAETVVGNLPPVPVSLKVSTYTVRTGDTIDKIAKRFGLRQDTLVSMNNLQGPQSVKPGIQLKIPNMDGIAHKVRKGDSLLSIAKSYGADMTRLVDANNLEDGKISVGQSLFIPNARLASATMQNFYSVNFVWPVRGPISSPFGYRTNPFTGLKTYHSALDIAIPLGTKVKATRAGTVADTGYNSVFGNYIILKHSNGYQSLYGHLSSIGVREGQSVDQGAVIGNSGNTGESTGPHLHFSIFQNGKALDPRKFVK